MPYAGTKGMTIPVDECPFEEGSKIAVDPATMPWLRRPKAAPITHRTRHKLTQEERVQRHKAHQVTKQAVKKGLLVRQSCEVCGATPAQAHHDDYRKPLAVRWLCQKCHAQHHATHI